MDTSSYNDYVLDASLQAGWITEDQQQTTQAALARIDGAPALNFMLEQQLLSKEQHDQLLNLIMQAMEQVEKDVPKEDAHAATSPSAVIQGKEAFDDHGGTAKVTEYLKYAVDLDASDLHLGPDSPPLVRYNGNLGALSEDAKPFSPEDAERLAKEFLTKDQIEYVEEFGSIDFCYEVPGLGRFRTSVVRQRRGWESVFRVIASRMRSMEELGMPEVMYKLIKYHNGLVLVTGAVGSGKTTTLAAMVDQINQERKDHIITLEEPIEYVFKPTGCQITQREIRSHTDSFATALRGSLRQDPDVIMVGEM
ncbi:MAG: ATPase, T2SS/T4P/T4SS family, partial [Verrucomicrobiota bacterium]